MSSVIKLLDQVDATGAGESKPCNYPKRVFQAFMTGTGAVSATVKAQGSLDDEHWTDLGTITLSGTDEDDDSFAIESPYKFVRGNVTAISGADAMLTLNCGAQP